MNKIVIMRNNGKIEIWDNVGQSPNAINMSGCDFVGYTNPYIFANSLKDLQQKMQKDINNNEYKNYSSMRDWAMKKYNLS